MIELNLWDKLKQMARQHIYQILVAVFLIGLFISCIVLAKVFQSPFEDQPCHYYHSVNISGGVHHENGSITFDNITYTENMYFEVEHVIRYKKNDPHIEKVKPYIRGCIFNMTKCMYIDAKDDDDAYEKNKKIISSEFNHTYKFINEQPCGNDRSFYNYNITDTYKVDLGPDTPNHAFLLYDDETKNISFGGCDETAVEYLKINISIVLPYVCLVSVAFIIATIFLYICLPELRNLHGKCLMSYLLSLAVAFTFLSSVEIYQSHVDEEYCIFIAYALYLSFQLAFIWLSVICFDLWWTFSIMKGVLRSMNLRFILYTIFVLTTSLIFVFIAYVCDNFDVISSDYRPNMGTYRCYLHPNSVMIYFYWPLFVLSTLNIILFILTAFKIQSRSKLVMSTAESKKHQNNEDNFFLFVRLFTIMGGCWIMEVISFRVSQKGAFFFAFDVWNSSIGIWIFLSTVSSRRVLSSIKKKIFSKPSSQNGSTNTSTSMMSNEPAIKMQYVSGPN